MSSELPEGGCTIDKPVEYFLRLGTETYPLNPSIGCNLCLKFTGKISCIECGRTTKKSFNQGYCYPCFKRLAQCDLCIVSPERCHFDQGTCRDAAFARDFCMQPHIVYLSFSSGLKVGITRAGNLNTRWIDQGALQALPIFQVLSRQQSGFVEVAFKDHVSDKTHWQKMLKTRKPTTDLLAARDELIHKVKNDLREIKKRFGLNSIRKITKTKGQNLTYPIEQYPSKVLSLSFDKTPELKGRLWGIKGQYLILEHGVINLRKFAGYEINFSTNASNA